VHLRLGRIPPLHESRRVSFGGRQMDELEIMMLLTHLEHTTQAYTHTDIYIAAIFFPLLSQYGLRLSRILQINNQHMSATSSNMSKNYITALQ